MPSIKIVVTATTYFYSLNINKDSNFERQGIHFKKNLTKIPVILYNLLQHFKKEFLFSGEKTTT